MTQALLNCYKTDSEPLPQRMMARSDWYVWKNLEPNVLQQELLQLLQFASRSELDQANSSVLPERLLPLWQRLVDPANIQHINHHYPLDVHVLNVIENTRLSKAYQTLEEPAKRLAMMGALLHDIDKNTGLPRFAKAVPVDRIHPIKSAEASMPALSRLGFDIAWRRRLYTIIHHHQQFGGLFARYNNDLPSDEDYVHIALKLRNMAVLGALLALSEGDIRSVQRPPGYFTPDVDQRLPQYGQAVASLIQTWQQTKPWLPLSCKTLKKEPLETLTEFSGYVSAHDSLEDLLRFSLATSYGGAVQLPYVASKAALEARINHSDNRWVALWGCLPEDLASVRQQAAFDASPQQLPMPEFYASWQQPNELLVVDDWVTLRNGLEAASLTSWQAFLTHPGAQALGQACYWHFEAGMPASGSLYGLITRPVLMAVLCPHSPSEAETRQWIDRLRGLDFSCVAL